MARIAGIEIPNHKRVEVGLTYIYGIGRPKSRIILESVKVDLNKKIKDLTAEELSRIRKHIESDEMVEGDLKKKVNQDIKRLMDINCYEAVGTSGACLSGAREPKPTPGRAKVRVVR